MTLYQRSQDPIGAAVSFRHFATVSVKLWYPDVYDISFSCAVSASEAKPKLENHASAVFSNPRGQKRSEGNLKELRINITPKLKNFWLPHDLPLGFLSF